MNSWGFPAFVTVALRCNQCSLPGIELRSAGYAASVPTRWPKCGDWEGGGGWQVCGDNGMWVPLLTSQPPDPLPLWVQSPASAGRHHTHNSGHWGHPLRWAKELSTAVHSRFALPTGPAYETATCCAAVHHQHLRVWHALGPNAPLNHPLIIPRLLAPIPLTTSALRGGVWYTALYLTKERGGVSLLSPQGVRGLGRSFVLFLMFPFVLLWRSLPHPPKVP